MTCLPEKGDKGYTEIKGCLVADDIVAFRRTVQSSNLAIPHGNGVVIDEDDKSGEDE